MTTIQVGCDLTYSVTSSTSFMFNVAAARTAHQNIIEETLQLTPTVQYEAGSLGSEAIQVYRLTVEPCDLQLQYRAIVDLSPEMYDTSGIIETGYSQLPNEVLLYLNPSRYCESDRLAHFALQTFGNVQPGFSRVTAICDWINANLDYQAGSTGESTSACDVLIQRVGVCRDYAHLAIALCRALCIPARYVSGYAVALQPPDFHGFFEAYLGSRWYLFDATRMAPVEGFVRIGTGRDAADASFATIIGAATLTTMAVWAEQTRPDQITTQMVQQSAVSTTN
ncbi:transglutaminase-like domain-containing protein [Methylobacter psychrophilus]|jgi:transglutaminase-like putative cysteine protease|uniref:transglutaminase-like domain-containing protein n=1 Tax=Methylobacter psychrophilus TaxID=96941 RepID=UPI0021D4DA26|nr:transglutaminase family protein [Methylobacter psychrophilus]